MRSSSCIYICMYLCILKCIFKTINKIHFSVKFMHLKNRKITTTITKATKIDLFIRLFTHTNAFIRKTKN